MFGLHPYSASFAGRYQTAVTIADSIKYGLFVHGSKKSFIHMKPPPHENFKRLPQALQDLFVKAFDVGHANPSLRPTASEWGQTAYSELIVNRATIKAFPSMIKTNGNRTNGQSPGKTYAGRTQTGRTLASLNSQRSYAPAITPTVNKPAPRTDFAGQLRPVVVVLGILFLCWVVSLIGGLFKGTSSADRPRRPHRLRALGTVANQRDRSTVVFSA